MGWTHTDGRLRLHGDFYQALSGLEDPDGVNFVTQTAGLVPHGGIARPFGAESVHTVEPRCAAKDMGKGQVPLGGRGAGGPSA